MDSFNIRPVSVTIPVPVPVPDNCEKNNEYEITIEEENGRISALYIYPDLCRNMNLFPDCVCTSLIIRLKYAKHEKIMFPPTLKKLALDFPIEAPLTLPDNLEHLKIFNKVTSLITLPDTLCHLTIRSLMVPLKFPDSLEDLDVGNLTSLNLVLPKHLKKLTIVAIKTYMIIPESLIYLSLKLDFSTQYFAFQHILDNLPNGLKILKLSLNFAEMPQIIFCIENIPHGLIGFCVEKIQITNIRVISTIPSIKYFKYGRCKIIKSDCPTEIIKIIEN